jgi:hypothetical protein
VQVSDLLNLEEVDPHLSQEGRGFFHHIEELMTTYLTKTKSAVVIE